MTKYSNTDNALTFILNPSYEYIVKTIEYLNKNILDNNFPYLRTNETFDYSVASEWISEQEKGNQARAICIKNGDKVVGAAYIKKGRGRQSHNATLAVTVCPNHQRLGIGYKLCKMLIEVAPKIGIIRIEDYPLVIHEAALNILKKLGFKKEGVMRKLACLHECEYVDCIYMVLFLNDDFS